MAQSGSREVQLFKLLAGSLLRYLQIIKAKHPPKIILRSYQTFLRKPDICCLKESRHCVGTTSANKRRYSPTGMTSPYMKTLLAFDFDHTVIDGNSDIELQTLHPGEFPDDIKKLYCDKDGWTDYMGAIFALLHSEGVQADAIKGKILQIPLVSGMKELFDKLAHERYEVVIISDANTLFIDWLMKQHGISSSVLKVYSNPAEVTDDGKLTIQYYHHQDWCNLSSKNMCKGHILENHIKEQQEKGVVFSRVMYVGDGQNDFCPTLRLSANDYVFPRTKFSLERVIKQDQSTDCKVKATVVPWACGKTILETINSLDQSG